MANAYTFLADLAAEAQAPDNGILSRTLQNDEKTKIVLFAFSPGQELSAHTAPMPAVLYFLEGSARLTLGDDVMDASAGALVHMPPNLRHGIQAASPLKLLLILIKKEA